VDFAGTGSMGETMRRLSLSSDEPLKPMSPRPIRRDGWRSRVHLDGAACSRHSLSRDDFDPWLILLRFPPSTTRVVCG
jgi:hypothetical protein